MGDFSTSALSNRTMSAFPVSIGTSLALESMFQPMQPAYDPERVIPKHIDISEYQVFWVNLLTLYRNIIGALSKEGEAAVMAGDLSDTLKFEVDLIERLVQQESLGRCQVVFYASNYDGMARAHPHATVREAKTDKQRVYNATMEATIGDFFKTQVKSERVQHFERLIEPKQKRRGLILTHMAYDLLAVDRFDGLDLIESHTGVLKTKGMWYTKLAGSKELVMMPFNVLTLQVYGDSNTFAPMNQKVRQQLLELAQEFKWNPMISRERIRFSLGQYKDHFTRQVLESILTEQP